MVPEQTNMDDGFTSSPDEEMTSVEIDPKDELLFRFKLIKRYNKGYFIPEDLEGRDLEDLQSLYRETIHKINSEQKAKYVNTIKEIYKSMRSDHPEELDDPKYIEGVTSEEIQELCKSKGLDLEQMANIYAIIKTVAIASGASKETSGCCVQ